MTFTAVDGSTSLGTFTTTLTAGTSNCTPTITSFTPTAGFTGTSVVITGTKFTGATAVKFNGTSASAFTVNSADPDHRDRAERVHERGDHGDDDLWYGHQHQLVQDPGPQRGWTDGCGRHVESFRKPTGLSSGDTGYVSAADLNGDSTVDDSDLQIWLDAF